MAGAEELVEIGSGTASKTRALLYAMAGAGSLRRYVPFDCDRSVVEACADELTELYPGLRVHGVVGDFGRDLEQVPDGERRLFAFLGGTIGNLYPDERVGLPGAARRDDVAVGPALVGTDLVKDRAVLEAAYNDAAGVTAEFNRNVLRVLNDGLDGDFDPDAFEHVAFFDGANSWIEMRLRACGEQEVRLEGADLTVQFADGEELRTEISTKFTREGVERELLEAGLRLDAFMTDDGGRSDWRWRRGEAERRGRDRGRRRLRPRRGHRPRAGCARGARGGGGPERGGGRRAGRGARRRRARLRRRRDRRGPGAGGASRRAGGASASCAWRSPARASAGPSARWAATARPTCSRSRRSCG